MMKRFVTLSLCLGLVPLFAVACSKSRPAAVVGGGGDGGGGGGGGDGGGGGGGGGDRARVLTMSSPRASALDPDAGLLYFTDSGLAAVLVFDLARRELTLLSGAARGTGPEIKSPKGIALDLPNHCAYVAASPALLAIDLFSGDRRVVAAVRGEGVALDPRGNRVFLTPKAYDSTFHAVDLATGAASLLSGATRGQGPTIDFAFGAAFDPATNRLIATDARLNAVVAVDVATGDRSVIAQLGPDLDVPMEVAIDLESNRALVANVDWSSRGGVIGVHLATGAWQTISGRRVGTGEPFAAPQTIALDARAGRALVIDATHDAVFAVELATGNRSMVWSYAVGAGPKLGHAKDLAIDSDGNRAYAYDMHTSKAVAIDLASGERSVVYPLGLGGTEPQLRGECLAFSPGRLVLGNRDATEILEIDLARRSGRLIAPVWRVATPPHIEGLAFTRHGRILALYQMDENRASALVSIDPASGFATVVSAASASVAGAARGAGVDFPVDATRLECFPGEHGDLVLICSHTVGVLLVDVASGNRSVLCDRTVNRTFGPVVDLTLSRDLAEAFVLDQLGKVFAVDLATGSPRAVASNTSTALRLRDAQAIALHPSLDAVVVFDGGITPFWSSGLNALVGVGIASTTAEDRHFVVSK